MYSDNVVEGFDAIVMRAITSLILKLANTVVKRCKIFLVIHVKLCEALELHIFVTTVISFNLS